MHKTVAAIILVSIGDPAWAQMTPQGLWRIVDDKTGEAKAEIRISETPAGLSGKIEKRLFRAPGAPDVCVPCSDERKDQPILGLEIIRGAKKAEGQGVWEGGKILDPENGRNYTLKMTPVEDGKKLDVRGSFGPFGRTQTWVRIQ